MDKTQKQQTEKKKNQTQKGKNVWFHSFKVLQKGKLIYNGKITPVAAHDGEGEDWLQRGT